MDQLYKKGYEGEIAFLEAKQELSDINAKLRETELEKEQLVTESDLINQKMNSLTIEFERKHHKNYQKHKEYLTSPQ